MPLTQTSLPPGVVFPFAGSSAPSGFLLCDGSAVSRTTYQALFEAIGTSHGTGDGSTTFNVPDYRGRFHRGQDQGQGRDPDAGSRTQMAPGANSGDAVGSLQGNAFQTHTHAATSHQHNVVQTRGNIQTFPPGSFHFSAPFLGNGAATGTGFANIQDAVASGTWAQATFNETRPVNADVNYIIRY